MKCKICKEELNGGLKIYKYGNRICCKCFEKARWDKELDKWLKNGKKQLI